MAQAKHLVVHRSLHARSQVVPGLNEWRRELGLPPVTRVFRDWIHSPQRVIGLFPDWFGVPQSDWPASLRLAGFPLFDDHRPTELAPSLRRFLDDGPPPVLFTPGTANQAAARFFRAGVDAAESLGRRALLLTRYTGHLPKLPPTAHHEPFVPLSDVLPRCAALVSHGGIGTLAQGLAAGVPQLTMPMGFDRPDNATRLEGLVSDDGSFLPSSTETELQPRCAFCWTTVERPPAAASGRNGSGRAMPSKKPAICSSSLHNGASQRLYS